MKTYNINTTSKDELIDIAGSVSSYVSEEKIHDGMVLVYVPHTTAGVTINEGADPSVKTDILHQLRKIAPVSSEYRHMEGNSDGHIKTSILGNSVIVPVSGGNLALGTWQTVYFCEFDGPRRRKYFLASLK